MNAAEFMIECFLSDALSARQSAEVRALCRLAYDEDLNDLFEAYGPGTHLLGFVDGRLVSHVMWVTRWLQPGGMAPLRTAYVEMVATHPAFSGRGYATRLMREVPGRVDDFGLAALCPADTTLYERLGWTFWRGPLFIRQEQSLLPTPEERVMILPLPRTPELDLDSALSAEWREGEVW
jgi:GNAT superfamily N-acetyltransferase